MKLHSKHIFLKSILLAVVLGIVFCIAEAIEYSLAYKMPFIDAYFNNVSPYSLFIRLGYVAIIVTAGGVIGFLLERGHKRIAALLAKERDYHEAISAVNEGIFTYIFSPDKIDASTLCYSILGYSPDEFGNSRDDFYNLIAPGEREELEKALAEHIEKCKPFLFELKMKTKNGKWKWILLKGNVQESNEDGSPKRLRGIFVDIDQQVKTRNRLEEYTARLEEAEKIAHVGHWEFDYKSRKSSWSREIFNILQIPLLFKKRDNLRTVMRFVHPEDKKRMRRIFWTSIRERCNFDCVYRVLLKDKSIKYISQRGHHVFDGSGHITRSFGTIQDITTSSLTTQALINSEKRYRILFDNVYQGIIIIDRKTRQIKLANKVFRELFGYTRGKVLNCHLKDLHPNDNFQHDSAWIEVKEKAFSGNVNCLRGDGSVFPAKVHASSVILDEHPCVIAIFRDLTESYRIKYDRHMLKVAVDNSDVEIVINNPDGSIDYCSPALCRRLGYTSDEIKKMYIWDVETTVRKEDIGRIWKQLKATKTQRGEGVQIAKDGTRCEINYVADYTKIGSRELICCRIQDVTESKKKEAILENARKKAEESDRLKSIFLANMGHEIRTPMNGILGFADLLQRDGLSDEKYQQYAKIISECGNNLMQLFNDILDISRIEAGEMDFKKEDFCVNQIIEELYNFYEPQTRRDGKKLSLQMHKSLRDNEAVIYSDKRYLRQILTNLLNNALKFTEKGEILIGYNAKRSGIEFFVRNSGNGIAPELLDKIFEPFRQGEEILSRKHHGSGLGLTIAKSYVESLGGYMWVESELGRNTTFYFTLPHSANSKVQISSPALPTETDYDWKDKTFLIVEDKHITFMLLENLLENTGAKVHRAKSAQQSVDMAKSIVDLDLILMDVRLPDFSGWEASRMIKKANPALPIIVQTANASAEDKIKTFQAGCDAYLTKPIIKKEFYATLEKFLDKQAASTDD